MADGYNNPLEAQNVDDGGFDGGDVGQSHADSMFGGDILSGGEKQASKKPGLGADSKDTQGAQGARERAATSNQYGDKVKEGTIGGATRLGATNAAVGALRFVNKVTGRTDQTTKPGGLRGVFNKAIPVLIIVGVMTGFLGASVGGQMSLGVALAEQIMARFDNMSVENQLVGKSYMKAQLNPKTRRVQNGGEAHNYLKQHGKIYQAFTGDTGEKYFKMSEYQESKLKQKGIELVDFPDGSGRQYMQHTEYNQDGTVKRVTNVVADADQIGDIPGAIDFESAMATDADTAFATAYYEGAKTFRSAVGVWFKAKTGKLLEALGVSRNRFSEFDSTQDDAARKQQMLDTIEGAVDDQGIDGKVDTEKLDTEDADDDREEGSDSGTRRAQTDEYGDPITETDSDSFRVQGGDDATGQSQQAVEKVVKSKLDAVSEAAGQVKDLACMATEITGNINTIVTAYELLVTIRLAASILEGIQKTQVADSAESPIHEIINALTDKSNTRTIEIADVENTKKGSTYSITSGNDPDGENAKIETKKSTSNKSAMESAGIVALFGGTVTGIAADASYQSFNIMGFLRAIVKRLGTSMASVKGCAYTEMAQAAIQFAQEATRVLRCFLPPLVGCLESLLEEVWDKLDDMIWDAIKAVVRGVIISALVPFVAQILMRTVATSFFGEDLGNQIATGAKGYLTKIHKSQGGVYQTKDTYIAYLNMKEEYTKGEALYAQRTKSPFDASSPYTFAGNLFSKAVVINGSIASSSGGLGILSSIFNTVGSSAKSLVPGATAAGIGTEVQEMQEYTEENCPNQAAAGFIVDPISAICSTVVATTPYIVETDPGEALYRASQHDSRNFKDTGSETDLPEMNGETDDGRLTGKPEYAQYVRACYISDVEPGEPDYQIKNEYETATTNSTVGDALLGQVPLVGSAMSFFNSTAVISHASYIYKSACNPENDIAIDELAIPSKEERRDYSAIEPHARVAVAQGLTDQDLISSYVKEYYEENPIDLSFEGLLAHFSGFTKDMVIATINQMESLNFLAQYDPNGYGPLFYEEPDREYQVEEDNTIEQHYVIASNMFFEEHRYRNYAS